MATTIPDLNIELIYAGGKPKRAIIDMEALEALLDAAEDLHDIEILEEVKKQPLEFESFDEYITARHEAGSVDNHHADSSTSGSNETQTLHREAGEEAA